MATDDALRQAAEHLARLQPMVDQQVDAFRLNPRLPRRETADVQRLAAELQELASGLGDLDPSAEGRQTVRRLASREAELLFRLRREADIAYRTGVDPRWQQIDLDPDRTDVERIAGTADRAAPRPGRRDRPEQPAGLAPLSSGGLVTLGLRDRLLLVGIGILLVVVYVGLVVLRTVR